MHQGRLHRRRDRPHTGRDHPGDLAPRKNKQGEENHALRCEGHLGAVERSLSSLDRDGQPARAVTLARSYETTLEDLWDAATSAVRVPRWFLPISGELELGGRYQLEGNAGGVITACEPLSHFALTWEFGDVSWVEVHFSNHGAERARMSLTHTAHLSEHWVTYGPGAVGVGWEMGLLGMELPSHRTERAEA